MITRRRALKLLTVLGAAGCGREPEGAASAVLYSTVDAGYALGLISAYRGIGGRGARLVSDAEVAKSTGLVNRLLAERSDPTADVFLSGDAMRAAMLKEAGVLRRWEGGEVGGGLAGASADPEGYWMPMGARLRLLIVHRERARALGVRLESVLDLAEARVARHACLSNPLFGTGSVHAAALFEVLGAAKAREFFDLFGRNGGRVLASNGEVRKRVATGEFAVGVTDSDDYAIAVRDGAPVDYVIPDQGEGAMGVVVLPCVVALVNGARRPLEGDRLAGFLASRVAEEWMTRSEAQHFPLRPGAAQPMIFREELSSLRTCLKDPSRLWRTMRGGALEFLEGWVGGRTV